MTNSTTSAAAPDIGGPLRGLELRVQLIRVANPMDGDEEVLVDQIVRDIYPGVPHFLGPILHGFRRYAGTGQLRITRLSGDATLLGDIVGALRHERKARPEVN